ncbi:hypothetical protein AXG93_3890s1040 [Marchantia polymorpha subsp. ruderalis]|uniref:Uncharacterized protein n=1 Tax=Marchantia polymorpha subsp. ruderalis TaxID=1480154 RepID=A0A176WGT9_MARPO|nr:hypothetical protein AXG93_3890s1040 [Marchantia polymorpha subsp. ruderalis]
MAIEIKRKAPSAHTICEIVLARWGFHAHMVFLFFCFMTNIIVTAMLLLGGSAVVEALTGMNIYAASFLIPLVASVVIIVLPLYESWDTIVLVLNGMFTDDIMLTKMDEIDVKLQSIMKTNPEAERLYLLQKEEAKAKHEDEYETVAAKKTKEIEI